MKAVFLKGFKFHAQPQTGAYSCSILKAWFSLFIAIRNPFLNVQSARILRFKREKRQ